MWNAHKAKQCVIATAIAVSLLHPSGILEQQYDINSDLPTYIRVLHDRDPHVRLAALEKFNNLVLNPSGQGTIQDKLYTEAIQALIDAIKDQDVEVRRRVPQTLANTIEFTRRQNHSEGKFVPALAEALKDPDAIVRNHAAIALLNTSRSQSAISTLLISLKDPSITVKLEAAQALFCTTQQNQMTYGAFQSFPVISRSTAASALGSLIKDKSPLVRIKAAEVFGCIGLHEETAVPILLGALRDSDVSVQGHALATVSMTIAQNRSDVIMMGPHGPLPPPLNSELRPSLKAALPSLVGFLKGSDSSMKSNAIHILNRMGVDAKDAIPALLLSLRDQDPYVRLTITSVLGDQGNSAYPYVPVLQDLELHDPDRSVRDSATRALKSLGAQSISTLIAALQSPDKTLKINAADALAELGSGDKAAIPFLVDALKDTDTGVRRSAMIALGYPSNGPDTSHYASVAPDLIVLLKSPYPEVREFASTVLLQAGPTAKTAVPSLIVALRDDDPTVQSSVAKTLGGLGDDAGAAVPALIDCLTSSPQKINVRDSAAYALDKIAASARDAQDTSLAEPLTRAAIALDAANFPDRAKTVATAARILKSLQGGEWYQAAIAFIVKHPFLLLPLAFYAMLFALCRILLVFSPLTIWQVNEFVASHFRLWRWKLLEASVTDLLIVGLFQYHKKVLDAWVLNQLPSVSENFKRLPTVAENIDPLPGLPVRLGSHDLDEDLKPFHLRESFSHNRTYLLLHGEGGIGKTTIACKIARWVMSHDERDRPSVHPMLPVLIEGSFKPDEGEGESILDIIRGKLGALANLGEDPPAELVRRLLRKQRILVIIDGLSEMNDASRRSIQPDSANFDANALVVTSRFDVSLMSIPNKTTISPLRIPSTLLPTFFKSYASRFGKDASFEENEPLFGAVEFAKIVGNRPITVLLAKQYVKLMIDRKMGFSGEMPENVPDLMLAYLNHLNRPLPGVSSPVVDQRDVHHAAKTIAWECVREALHSASAPYASISDKFGDETIGTQMITYLNEDLRLLQITGAGLDRVSFTLDPLAEYLAAIYLLEANKSEEDPWRKFLAKAAATVSSGSSSGFLRALRDCCVSKGADNQVPSFVVDELDMLLNGESDKGTDCTGVLEVSDVVTSPETCATEVDIE